MKFTEELLNKINSHSCIEICLRDERYVLGDIYYNTCYYHEGTDTLNFEIEDNNCSGVSGTIKLSHIKGYKEESSYIKVITK